MVLCVWGLCGTESSAFADVSASLKEIGGNAAIIQALTGLRRALCAQSATGIGQINWFRPVRTSLRGQGAGKSWARRKRDRLSDRDFGAK